MRGNERNAAQGNPRPLGAQHKARSEHGLAPAPRCATPVPARGAAERRRGVEARVRGNERGAAQGKERARARSGTSLRHTGACARRGRKAARRRGAGMEVGRHETRRERRWAARMIRAAARYRCGVGLGETWTGVDLVWGRRVATTSSRGAPCPPSHLPKERESS